MKQKLFYYLIFSAIMLTSCKQSSKTKGTLLNADHMALQQIETVKQVVGIGLIVPQDLITNLAVQLPGTLIEIDKHPGDSVKAGEIILRMDDRDEQLALQKLKKQLETQHFQIMAAQADMNDKKIQLENKQSQLKSSIQLQKSGAETLQNLDDLRTTVRSLEAELQTQEANLGLAKSQLGPLEVDIQQAMLNVDKKNICAPTDGTILQVTVANHSSVNQYQSVVTFAPKGRIIARCEIDELFASQVKLGQQAQIRYIGFSEIIATGKVVLMAPFLSQKSLFVENATDQQDRRVREVHVELDHPQNILFNSRVEVTILTR